jgi:predicted acylesterase/phospholipase RssA
MAIGLVLGGGAPNLPLMTGALLALDEAGVEFKVITTTGAGMVVGLLYAAPRENETDNTWEKARRAALGHTRDWGIDDMIYEMVPINYKIFQKPGPMARAFAHATNPFLWSIPRGNRRQRLLGDTLALMASVMSPSNLKADSKGLCQPPPWIELLVDFDKLTENLEGDDIKFRLSAYCIDDENEKTFHREDITVEHFKAALAMPFIYAPYKLKDKDGKWKTYLEGSAFKTLQLNPGDVMAENDIDTVIFFDIMGNRNLIGEPRWLIDAWGKSIVAPLTRLAEQGLDDFKLKRELHKKERRIKQLEALLASGNGAGAAAAGSVPDEADDSQFNRTELLRMPFRDHIPEERWPEALDWSYSNMSALFDIGVETGEKFFADNEERLVSSMEYQANPP